MRSDFLSMVLTIGASLCPFIILILLGSLVWAIYLALREGIAQLRRWHRVPCDRCVYFTGSQYLKCTIHPCKALTEEALNCSDFEPNDSPARAYAQSCESSRSRKFISPP